MNLVSARSLPLPALTALFNAGYSGYLTPLAFDEPTLRRHVADNDIDLDVSRVATDPDPAAFALIGRRGREAWVGGMGTVPERRRHGLGRRTLTAALEAAAADGAESARLEVLEPNDAAIALYERLGFTTTRRVIVATLDELDPPHSDWRPMAVDAAHEWIAAHRSSPEPWQRDDALVHKAATEARPLTAIVLEGAGGEIAAAGICAENATATLVVQIAATDEAAAAEGLRAAGRATGGKPLRLLNFPIGENVASAVAGLGVAAEHVQYEMRLGLAGS